MATQRQTLEQGRAKHAFDAATEAAKRSDKNDYKSYVKKTPMLIKTNGLGATIAFMQSKSKDSKGNDKAYGVIISNLESWFKNSPKLSAIYKSLPGDNLVAKVVECETANYRALTTESLAYLNWLRRFAEGLIKDEK